jgi:hypothetical protein
MYPSETEEMPRWELGSEKKGLRLSLLLHEEV